MADREDEDHTAAMESGLERLDQHIAEAEDKKAYVDSKAERAGDAIEGGPEHGGKDDTLSASGSDDAEDGDDSGSSSGDDDPSRPHGEVDEEQANPT